MAINTVTLAQLRTRARQRADMENSAFISDSEMLALINQSYAELYDLLVATNEDYFTTSAAGTISAVGSRMTLPSDFYKLRGLEYLSGTDYITMLPFTWAQRNKLNRLGIVRKAEDGLAYRIVGDTIHVQPESDSVGTYRIWYIPAFTPLSADADLITSAATRNGWDEYIVLDVAIKMLDKQESDARHLERQKASITKRIEAASMDRDADQPERVVDVQNLASAWDEVI